MSVYSSYRLTLHLHLPTLSPSTTIIVYTPLIFTNTMGCFLYSIFNQTLSSTSTIIVYTPFTITNAITHLALNPCPKSSSKFEASEFEIEFMPGVIISTRKVILKSFLGGHQTSEQKEWHAKYLSNYLIMSEERRLA